MIPRFQAFAAGRSFAPPRLARAVLVSLLLTAPALMVSATPGAVERLEYDRFAMGAGEVWRAATCHWTHWSSDHLEWDVLAFVPLVALAWFAHPRRTSWVIASSALIIPLSIWFVLPDMVRYRGLSGIDSALFVFVAVTMLRRTIAGGSRGVATLVAILTVGFVGKIVFEITTGSPLFAEGSSYVPVPLAHLVGGTCGWIIASAEKGVGSRVASCVARPRRVATGTPSDR